METYVQGMQIRQDGQAAENPANSDRSNLMNSVRGSQVTKIIMIGFLAMLLQIPIAMIRDTIGERQQRNNQAMEEIAAKWGREQNIVGPIITVPFEREVAPHGEGIPGNRGTSVVIEYANFLAEDLRIDAKTDNLSRHRGIFDVPVYRVNLTLAGRFNRPDFAALGVEPARILWEKASLSILISDPRTISNQAALVWNGEKIDFQSGTSEVLGTGKGIQVSLNDKLVGADSFDFSCQLSLQGSGGLFFAPMGRNTSAAIESNWPDPSFQGDWLPIEQTNDQKGFRASWQIASFGRNFSQHWINKANTDNRTTGDLFGVNFIRPVDTYRMVERSVKYQLLFLALTFITLWLFEVLAGVRLHALQYLLVGGGMCIFYLLELSLAEHVGFFTAYLLATSAIVALESYYCMAILKSLWRSAVVGGFITVLYGYLYTLLINQDYALLAGSIGSFLLLATIMYLTRKIDWYSLKV